MSAATIFRVVAAVVGAAATALQPVYGKQPWYVAVVGVGAALALLAPSVVRPWKAPRSSARPTNSGSTSSGGRLSAGGR